ncbi:MAG: hypothetical protein AAFZ15_27610 [Bacteroidota bacterium]
MKIKLFFPFFILMALTFNSCGDDECSPGSHSGTCIFDPDNVSITIKTVEDLDADLCEPDDAVPCPVYCSDEPCKIEIGGNSQGLSNITCDWVYAWVKYLDRNDDAYYRHENPIYIDPNGDWTENIILGQDGVPSFNEEFEIILTVSNSDILETSTLKFDELGVVDRSDPIRVGIVGCFNPDLVSNFRIVEIQNKPVVDDEIKNIDCSSVLDGVACRVIVKGTSEGIYGQDCARIVVLIKPSNTNKWFFQDDVSFTNSDGKWLINVQLGDITAETDPRGQFFHFIVFVTSEDVSKIPPSFNVGELPMILPSSTSKESIEVLVKVDP